MKKKTSKQAKKTSKLAKAENLKKKQAQLQSAARHPDQASCHSFFAAGKNQGISQVGYTRHIIVKNAEGDPDTVAEIIIQNAVFKRRFKTVYLNAEIFFRSAYRLLFYFFNLYICRFYDYLHKQASFCLKFKR